MKIFFTTIICFVFPFSPELNHFSFNVTSKIDFPEIRSEIEWFITKTKLKSVYEGKYNVYLVKIYEQENRYCVSMGIIDDQLHLPEALAFKYFIEVNGELVLMDYCDDFRDKYEINEKEIKLLDKGMITNRIHDSVVFLGTTPGYVCCYESMNITKNYYWTCDDIPDNQRIFKPYVPKGQVMRIDSNTFKSLIRKKKE